MYLKRLLSGVLLTSPLLLACILSCGSNHDEEPRFEIYNYVNQTSFEIVIERYWDGSQRTFQLSANGLLTVEAEIGPAGNISDVIDQADSVLITYDNDRSLWLKRGDPRSISILNQDNYTRSVDGNTTTLEYRFTMADYDAAD